MKRVYYAHSLALYNTPQEERDIKLLTALGFEVVNRNTEQVQVDIQNMKKEGRDDYMQYFNNLIKNCDAVAYRAFIDLKIGSGVLYEIKFAKDTLGLPVFELPTITKDRELDAYETRNYLSLLGQR